MSSVEQQAVEQLKDPELEVIDVTILSSCRKDWQKVAMVVGRTERALEGRFPALTFVYYSLRLSRLVADGRLESRGDVALIRFSEVRLKEYEPSVLRRLLMVASLMAFVFPAILLAAAGYFWFQEEFLGLDTRSQPQTLMERLEILAGCLPMILLMLLAILLAGIPWMYAMSRLLPWPDLEFYTKLEGRRIPVISDWLDRLWLRMIQDRRPSAHSVTSDPS